MKAQDWRKWRALHQNKAQRGRVIVFESVIGGVDNIGECGYG